MPSTTTPKAAQTAPFNAFRGLTNDHLKHRHRLLPVEPGGKRPMFHNGVEWKGVKGWQLEQELTASKLANYQTYEALNQGLVLGPHSDLPNSAVLVCFDLDITDPILKAKVEAELRAAGLMEFHRMGHPDKLGAAFVVIDQLGLGEKFGKQTVDYGNEQKVELLADGEQVVINGLHTSGGFYTWADTDKRLPQQPVSALPRLTRAECQELMTKLAKIGGASPPTAATGMGVVGHAQFPALNDADARAVQGALEAAKNDFERGVWVQVLKAYRACCEPALGLEQVVADLSDFDDRYVGGGDGGAALDAVLAETDLPVGFGLGQLAEALAARLPDDAGEQLLAMSRRALAQHAFDGVPIDWAHVAALVQVSGPFNNANLKNTAPKTLASLLAVGAAKLPPRSWLVRGLLMNGALTVVGGAGGGGKSSLLNMIALSVASGKPLVGFDLRNPNGEHVLILNADDDEAEVTRRFAAAVSHHGVAPEVLDRVHVLGSDKLPGVKCSRVDGHDLIINAEYFDLLADMIRATGAKLVILDPLFGLADLDENSNAHAGQLAGFMNRFAQQTGVALVLVAHANKGGLAAAAASGGDRSANLIAGGRRLLDAARAAFVVDSLGEADAVHVGMGRADDRLRQMFGLWSVKGNYMARGDARAYFQTLPVGLNNGHGLDPADTVGVVVRFTPIRAVASHTVLLAILDLIAAGSPTGPYTRHKTGSSNPRFIVPAIVAAVDWLAEGYSGPPSERNILELLDDKVFGLGLAEEKEVQVRCGSRTRGRVGLSLTPAGEAEKIRIKSEIGLGI